MDNVATRSGVYDLYYKSWWDHVKGVFSQPWELLLATLAVITAVSTVGQLSIQFLDANPKGWSTYIILVAISFVLAIVWRVYRYINTCPVGLERASPRAQRIAHLQRPKWEFALAKELLDQKLLPLDRECKDLLEGHVFVLGYKPPQFADYVRFLQSQIDNLRQMLKVANHLLLDDLPSSMRSSDDKPASPIRILESTEAVERFYRETIEFERLSHATTPSSMLSNLHQLQIGMAEPIRDAVQQMLHFLDRMCALKVIRNTRHNMQCNIVFKEPVKLNELFTELAKAQAQAPDIAARW